MSDAVADIANSGNLHLDFFDRNRVATWTRDHPGILTWVRERIGRPLSGWRSYGDWTRSSDDADAPYLLDDAIRLHGGDLKGEGSSVLKGIQLLRSVLTSERGVVRLVGLSGTGKTRLAEALFDSRVGVDYLPPELAIYTNLSDDPNPQPVAVATELVAQLRRQILVIDNCPPDLHSRLSEVCRSSESKLSVLTIEYDVREDQPESTTVANARLL